jgi:uncharacterized repeat protein (TIGR01451 family)
MCRGSAQRSLLSRGWPEPMAARIRRSPHRSRPERSRSSLRRFVSLRAAWRLAAVCYLLLTITGCHHFGLPAIDPVGERIFLPKPNQMQWCPDHGDCFGHGDSHGHGLFPKPAFQDPPPPPPCAESPAPAYGPSGAVGSGLKHKHTPRGERGQMLLTPTRIVAPVQGEVVLLAGICGDDGFLVTGEPIEWMLAPGSVGNFLEVGDDAKRNLLGSLHQRPKVEKLGVDYARGRTSNKEMLITRGSPNRQDTLTVRQGQTWISLSSPNEGVSRITALAPDSEIWDQRRQTATIYWVDAQWQFPPPQTLPADQATVLQTRVTRSEGLAPADGWLVRYRILNPDIARFDAGGEVAQQIVDGNGIARVGVRNLPGRHGTAMVVIEVARPAQPSDNMPELTLGRGQTSVTWSDSGLELVSRGPPTASLNQTLTYQASIANPGDLPADGVQLRMRIPSGCRVVRASPEPSQQSNTGLVWQLGQLPPHRQLDVSVDLVAEVESTLSVQFEAVAQPDRVRQSEVRTEVLKPNLVLSIQPSTGQTQYEVGQRVVFDVRVRNLGRQAIANLELVAESDPGLLEEASGTNRLRRQLSLLPPGQEQSLGIAFLARREGALGVRLQARSGEAVLASTDTQVEVRPAPPKEPNVSLQLTPTPRVDRLSPGQRCLFECTVTNNGQVPLTNLVLDLEYEAGLVPQQATSGAEDRSDQRLIRWRLPRLAAGQAASYRLELEAVEATVNETFVAAAVQTEQGVSASDRYRFTLDPPRAPTAAPDEGWQIQILPAIEQPRVGQDIAYTVIINNRQGVEDRDVVLELAWPEAVQLVSSAAVGIDLRAAYGQNNLRFQPIRFMRAGERQSFVLQLRSNLPGQLEILSRVSSQRQPGGVEESFSQRISPAGQ